ncbi:MAG: hypothetical protein MI976_01975 [Pseudomonadales bacterium]|nr:hypothetical protein [Pseudomonadales bacterium]
MKKKLLSISIASILATAIGCGGSGGGGGSNNNNDDDTPASQSSTLSGKASKGIIQSGLVTAFELDSSGTQIRSVGTATTSESGSYTLALEESYEGGPIQLVITATDATTMKCDALDGCGTEAFGTPIALPEGFAMNAIVAPLSAGSTISTQITPLSHMAAARALNNGTVDADAIADAISETSQIVGTNIQTTEIVDITDPASLASASETAKKLALVNAGLADLIVNGGAGVNEQLAMLASSFEDGQFSATDGITIGEITNSISDAIDDAEGNDTIADLLADASGEITTLIEVINGQTLDGNYNPEPSDTARDDAITQAKALISDTRTLVETIAENYDDPVDALELDAQTAEAVLSDDTALIVDLAGEAISQALDSLEAVGVTYAELLAAAPIQVPVTITDNEDQTVGAMTATLGTEEDNGFSITLNGSIAAVTIDSLKLAISIPESDTTFDEEESLTALALAGSESLALSGGVSNASGTALTFNDVSLTIELATDVTLDDDAFPSDEISSDGESNEDRIAETITGVTFNGAVTISANGSTFNGDITASLVALETPAVQGQVLSPEALSISGAFAGERGSSFEASVALDIRNASEFDVLEFIEPTEYFAGEYVITGANALFAEEVALASTALASYIPGATVINDSIVVSSNNDETIVDLRYSLLPGTSLPLSTSEISLWEPMQAKIEPILAEALGEEDYNTGFYIYQLDYVAADDAVTAEFWGYRESLEETPDHFIDAQLTLTTTLNVPDLPAANITTSLDRTGLEAGNFTFTVANAGQSYTIAASGDGDVDSFTLSNPDGVAILFEISENEAIEGTAYVGDIAVGTIITTNDDLTLIRYTDGTFETLF